MKTKIVLLIITLALLISSPSLSNENVLASDMPQVVFNGLLSSPTWSMSVVDDGEFHPFGIDLDLDDSGDPYIVFSFVDLFYAHKISGYWSIYKLDSGFADYPSIVLDSGGHIHVSYANNRLGNGLYYVTDRDGYWEIELISTESVAYTSIALDSSEIPYISYYTDLSSDLKYAARVGSLGNCGYDTGTLVLNQTWQCTDVEVSSDDVGSYNALAIDTSDIPHISYRDATNNKLKYAKYNTISNSWDKWELTSGGFFTSIALDDTDDPHIGYVSDNTQGIRYAYKDSIWKYEYIDAGLDFVYGASLWLDSADVPSVSYINMDTGQVNYAARVGSGGNCSVSGQWQCEVVSLIDSYGFETALQMDDLDIPYLAFTGSLNMGVKEGESWEIEPIEANVGNNSSIALVNGELPAISYTDNTFADLKFARWDGSDWNIELLASSSYADYSSLAFDDSGYAHLSYLHGGTLMFATDESGGWIPHVVDSAPDVGHYSSLDIDSDGNDHISYFDDGNDDLKYATNASGSWVNEVVDDDGGSFSRLALDGSGLPHISYFNSSNQFSYALFVGGGSGDCYIGSNWDCETYPYYGSYSDLARDASGNAYAIFSENSIPSSLRYWTRDMISGVTTIETIYTPSDGMFPYPIPGSITLDDENRPHITFCDEDSSELYYAIRVGSDGNCGDGDAWQCENLPYNCKGGAPDIALDAEDVPHISFGYQSSDNWTIDLMHITIEPVHADFEADPTSGFAPLEVSFINLSSGTYDACKWVFGDGVMSTGCDNPMHIYESPGTYTVSLIVIGAFGEDTETKTDYISVTSPEVPGERIFLPIIVK